MTIVADPSPATYRPLRPSSLLVQLAAVTVVEAALFTTYQGTQAVFHWSVHFLVGLTAAALWNGLYLALRGRPAPGQLAAVLVWHLVAMAPDVVFPAGVAHQPWMNVFLGHIAVHAIPGRELTWLAVGLAASGFYAALLSAWLRGRACEAEAGMEPGAGIGGIGLVRPQHDPRHAPLAHRHLGADAGEQVLLLHGLGVTSATWRPIAAALDGRELRLLAPDLLGFGGSRRVGTSFELADHVAALERLLRRHAWGRATVVGHSWGCAVAVALAGTHPESVRRLVLVNPPVFSSRLEVLDQLADEPWLTRTTLKDSAAAEIACGMMCLLRQPLKLIAPLARPDVPADIARDSLEHCWPAFRQGLMTLLERNPLGAALRAPVRPTTVVLGRHDDAAPPADVTPDISDRVDVRVLPGAHALVLTHRRELADLIATY